MPRIFLLSVVFAFAGCASVSQPQLTSLPESSPPSPAETRAVSNPLPVPVIHVFVALCDNVNQGIVPVSASLGNGDNPQTNLYWGAAFGVKTFFDKNHNWIKVRSLSGPKSSQILDRAVYRHGKHDIFLVADAYRGSEIKLATEDFLAAAAGIPGETIEVPFSGEKRPLKLGGGAKLVAYIGHNGLMDFQLESVPKRRDDESREAIILACASKSYFAEPLRNTGAKPLLWTTNLMAPEAYVLSGALDGWLNHETGEQVRMRAAKAYASYQRIGLRGATGLFATGW